MLLGMTGTRNAITEQQRDWLHKVLRRRPELHHGACVGADEEAHDIASALHCRIVVHPPIDERLMMPAWKWSQRDGIYIMPAKDYLQRNRNIVNGTEWLIAIPDGPERDSGGTWYTVRYALSVDKPVTICYPDGSIETRTREDSHASN